MGCELQIMFGFSMHQQKTGIYEAILVHPSKFDLINIVNPALLEIVFVYIYKIKYSIECICKRTLQCVFVRGLIFCIFAHF